jgi:hypothetical protein
MQTGLQCAQDKDSPVQESTKRVDPVETLVQIVNEGQEGDAEDERRLYDPGPLNGLRFRKANLSLRD